MNWSTELREPTNTEFGFDRKVLGTQRTDRFYIAGRDSKRSGLRSSGGPAEFDNGQMGPLLESADDQPVGCKNAADAQLRISREFAT